MENKKSKIEELAQCFINQLPQKSIRKDMRKKNNNDFSTLRDSILGTQSEYSISTKAISQMNEPHSKEHFIEINRELIKYAEPRLKPRPPIKIPQKLHIVDEQECDLSHFSDFDENIALIKGSFASIDNQCIIESSFPYSLLLDIEKCYSELIKDFNDNGFNDTAYKQRIALLYISLILDDDYPLKEVFINHNDINVFLIEELSLFFILVYLDEFNNDKLTENELINFQTCLQYSHINFLFVVMLIIENANVNSDINTKTDYNKCKLLIENNTNKIDNKKFQMNFHSQNKIIKNVLNNLLSNLNEINKDVSVLILEILNMAKKKNAQMVYCELKNNKKIENKLAYIKKKINESKEEEQYEEWNEEEEEDIQKPTVPFLLPKKPNDDRKYTLVLDLDETLVHFFEEENEDNAYVKVRMGTEPFIATLSKYFELVIFTASTKYYADIVIDGLDPHKLIEYRLYRQHTDPTNGFNLKDLSKLGRDLAKTIIIDNIEENYDLQPMNGLHILSFEGDENDCELNYLLNDLLEIPKKAIADVRDYLLVIRAKMLSRYSNLS